MTTTSAASDKLQDPADFVPKPFRFKDSSVLPRRKRKARKTATDAVFGSDKRIGGGENYECEARRPRKRHGARSIDGPEAHEGIEEARDGTHHQRENAAKETKEHHQQKEGAEDEKDEADVLFEEMVYDALDTPDGALVWERVFGTPISNFFLPPMFPPSFSSFFPSSSRWSSAETRKKFFNNVKRVLYERHSSHPHSQPPSSPCSSSSESDSESDQDAAAAAGRRKPERVRRKQNEKEARHARDELRKQKEDAKIMARIRWLVEEEEARKSNERRRGKWDVYLEMWRAWDGNKETIPWPVVQEARPGSANATHSSSSPTAVTAAGGTGGSPGSHSQVHAEGIRNWFLDDFSSGRINLHEFAGRLKVERVRWHPDRFLRRFGGVQGDRVDESLARDVTVIFQVLGQLWEEVKSDKPGGLGARRQRGGERGKGR